MQCSLQPSLTTVKLITSNQICSLHDPKIARRTNHLTKSTEQCSTYKGNKFQIICKFPAFVGRQKFLAILKIMLRVTIVSYKYSAFSILNCFLNLYESCVLYWGRAHRYPEHPVFFIFFSTITRSESLKMLHTLHFFLFKMPFIS
jgi:hypothetical protein